MKGFINVHITGYFRKNIDPKIKLCSCAEFHVGILFSFFFFFFSFLDHQQYDFIFTKSSKIVRLHVLHDIISIYMPFLELFLGSLIVYCIIFWHNFTL